MYLSQWNEKLNAEREIMYKYNHNIRKIGNFDASGKLECVF